MRTYVIDELQPEDLKKFTNYLQQQKWQSPLPGLYHIPVPDSLLNDKQQEHLQECGPYYLAIETGKTEIKLEMLVRAQKVIRCECIMYADARQREAMIDKLDRILKELDISV